MFSGFCHVLPPFFAPLISVSFILTTCPGNWAQYTLSEIEAPGYLLEPGDLLFARQSLVLSGAGKCSIILQQKEPVTFESHIIRVRLNKNLTDPIYYYYFFNSALGRQLIESIVEQVAAAGIRGSDLARLKVPYLPLPEQHKIARILSALDDKIELNRQMNKTLESIARGIFKSWFVDFDPINAKAEGCKPEGMDDTTVALFPSNFTDSSLELIPEGWTVDTLERVSLLNSESWSRNNTPDQIEYVDLANTKWGIIESTQIFSWKDAPSRAQRILRKGDTIVGTVRPGNGSYSFISFDGLTGSTGFAVLRPKETFYREFVYLSATSTENITRLAHLADGAAYPAVRPDVVYATPILFPGDEILLRFSQCLSPIMERVEINKKENKILGDIRDLLIPRLISGKLRIADDTL